MNSILNDNHVGIKKITLNGQITKNLDYGIGYAICWEDYPYNKRQSKQRYGAFLQDIICRCIQQSDFLGRNFKEEKHFDQVKMKLLEVLAILQKNAK